MSEIDHHVWMGRSIRDQWDKPSEPIHATSKEVAMERLVAETGVDDPEWEANPHSDDVYVAWNTAYYSLLVKKVPVYTDSS